MDKNEIFGGHKWAEDVKEEVEENHTICNMTTRLCLTATSESSSFHSVLRVGNWMLSVAIALNEEQEGEFDKNGKQTAVNTEICKVEDTSLNLKLNL